MYTALRVAHVLPAGRGVPFRHVALHLLRGERRRVVVRLDLVGPGPCRRPGRWLALRAPAKAVPLTRLAVRPLLRGHSSSSMITRQARITLAMPISGSSFSMIALALPW